MFLVHGVVTQKVFGAHQVVWSEFYWSQRGPVGFALNPNYPAHHLKALPAIHTEVAPCRGEPELLK